MLITHLSLLLLTNLFQDQEQIFVDNLLIPCLSDLLQYLTLLPVMPRLSYLPFCDHYDQYQIYVLDLDLVFVGGGVIKCMVPESGLCVSN